MLGAGQGMAEHGVGGGGVAGLAAQAAVGMNMMGPMMGQQMGGQPQFTPGMPQGGGAMSTCPKCGARQPQGKFCFECGTALAQAKKFCANCGSEVAPAGKFCSGCGTPQGGPPVGAPPSGG